MKLKDRFSMAIRAVTAQGPHWIGRIADELDVSHVTVKRWGMGFNLPVAPSLMIHALSRLVVMLTEEVDLLTEQVGYMSIDE